MRQKAILGGLVAGVAGVAAMTAAEKLEQVVTRRPNSFVPAHTLGLIADRLVAGPPGIPAPREAWETR